MQNLTIFLLILANFIDFTVSRTFLWIPNNNFRRQENWKDQSFPCNDDRILITSMNEMSAMIDVDINVEETVFPDNGVLFFGDRVKLQQGRPGWFDKQKSCDTVVGSDYETRDSRDAYFEETDFLSVYNPSSWHSDGDRNLHMNLVPSQRDDVLVGDTLAIQMSIEDTWNLRSLQMNGRRFTSISFKNFVSTIEGEFQVRLGHLLAKEKDKAEMQMQSPTTTVLNIVDEETDGYGIRNWNSNKNIMYIICQYVKAEPSDGICLNPIKPFGHCFPICGATIDFATNEVQIDDIMEILQKVQDESKTREKVVIILERVNDDDHSHDFQISLLPKDPSTFFDEKLYITLSYLIKEKLLRSAANTYSFFGFKIEHARTDYAYSISSKVIGSFIFFGTLLAILLYYHIKNGTFKRLNHSLYIPLPPVAFHRQNDTEVVELMNNVKNQESQKSHEEPVNELVNPNFEEVEEPSKESDQSERSLSKMESPLENSDEKFADIPMTLLDL